jgi:hypothetical protein
MDAPKIGRIVHYVLADGQHRPAMIVRVWPGEYGNDEVKDGVNLMVFLDGMNDQSASSPTVNSVMGMVSADECARGSAWRTSVRYGAVTPDGTGMLPGFWHWPERD